MAPNPDNYYEFIDSGVADAALDAHDELLVAMNDAVHEGVDAVVIANFTLRAAQSLEMLAERARTEREQREREASAAAEELAAYVEEDQLPIAPTRSATLGDISAPWVAPVRATPVDDDADDYEDEDYYDDEPPHPVDLVATVVGELRAEQVAELLATSIIPTLAGVVGAYEVVETAALTPTVTVLSLAARSDSEPCVYAMAPGSVVSLYTTDVAGTVVEVTITIAGAVDHEARPENPVAVANRLVAARVVGEADAAPVGIVVEFSRVDGAPLSDAALASPVEEARRSLSSLLGDVRVDAIKVGDGSAVRRVQLALDGGGDLETRAMRLATVSFKGTKEFDGVNVYAEATGTY